MGHTWHRCPMRPSSVEVAKVEQEFADQVLACVHLDDDWRQTVLKALANQGPPAQSQRGCQKDRVGLGKPLEATPLGNYR